MGSGHSNVAEITSSDGTVASRRPLRQDPNRIKGLARLITAKSKRRMDIAKHRYDRRKENMQLLRQLFKRLDPTLLQVAALSSRGELQLALKYESMRELLLVQVVRARALDARDLRGKSADAYVKLFLHPAQTDDDTPVKTTEVVPKTLNPVFREMFAFGVGNSQLQNHRLVAEVWNSDPWGNDEFIGQAVISLGDCDFEMVPTQLDWHSLQESTDNDLTGELEVSVSLRPSGVLAVTVHGAHGLTTRMDGRADVGTGSSHPGVMVKLQVPGMQDGLKQTRVQSDTTNPVWEETFELTVPKDELVSRYVVFHAIHVCGNGNNVSLGQIVVELSNVSSGGTFHGSLQLSDLKNSGRFACGYVQPTVVQELREALVAHAAIRSPQILFNQHDSDKIITVSSEQAGLQAKLKIIDGIAVQ